MGLPIAVWEYWLVCSNTNVRLLHNVKNVLSPCVLFARAAGTRISVEVNIQRTVPILELQHRAGAEASIGELDVFKVKMDIPLKVLGFCPVDSRAAGQKIPQSAAITLLKEQLAQLFKFFTAFLGGEPGWLDLHTNFVVALNLRAFVKGKHRIKL